MEPINPIITVAKEFSFFGFSIFIIMHMVCLLRNPMVKWKNLKMGKSKFYEKKWIENMDVTWKMDIGGILSTEKTIFWTFSNPYDGKI